MIFYPKNILAFEFLLTLDCRYLTSNYSMHIINSPIDMNESQYILSYLSTQRSLETWHDQLNGSISSFNNAINAFEINEKSRQHSELSVDEIEKRRQNRSRIFRLILGIMGVKLSLTVGYIYFSLGSIIAALIFIFLALIFTDMFLLPAPMPRHELPHYIHRFHDRQFQRQRRAQAELNGLPVAPITEPIARRPWIARFIYQLFFGFFLSLIPFWAPADYMD